VRRASQVAIISLLAVGIAAGILLIAVGITILSKSKESSYKGAIEWEVHELDTYKEIEIKTALADYIFSTEGGVLKSVFLYFAPYGTQPAELISDTTTDAKNMARTYLEGAIFPFRLYLGQEEDKKIYDFSIEEEEDRSRLVLRFTREADGLRIIKAFTIHNDPSYTLDLELSLANAGSADIILEEGLRMLLGVGIGKEKDKGEARYLFDGERSGDILDPASYKRFDGLGFISRQFALFLKNEGKWNEVLHPFAQLDERGRKVLGIKSDKIALSAGQGKFYKFTLYAGRLKYTLLERSGIEKIMDVGFFSQFLIPVVRFLDWLYKVTGNYGWAIILFTLVTRIILFPLMRQQYYSMARMYKLQPKLAKLRERYPSLGELRRLYPKMDSSELQRRARENREKLNQKMMELYRKEKINPLGGCLPMLIQLPILIILWQAIMYSAEQIHLSPSFLWMKDLSQRDPYYIIVILNVIVMILQSKLTPTTGGAQSQILIWAMPLFMAFLLRDFPAGLWLYWFLTTLVQVLQQLFVNWEMRRKGELLPAQAKVKELAADGENDE